MGDFRLIAIRPRKGCNPKFLKNLKPDQIYQFYQDYKFRYEDGNSRKDVNQVIYKPSVPSNFFQSEQTNLSVNISAIVGKNGCGKSTLVELLYAALYNLSVESNILDSGNRLNQKEDIKPIEDIKVEIYYEYNSLLLCLCLSCSKDANQQIKCIEFEANHKSSFAKTIFKRTKIIDNIVDTNNTLKEFLFFTMVVNYSQYALNSEMTGQWVQKLFHKNDGYQTPVVINPMRTKGKIDINTEDVLLRSRLLSNILRPYEPNIHKTSISTSNPRRLTENHTAIKLKLQLDEEKIPTNPNSEQLSFGFEKTYLSDLFYKLKDAFGFKDNIKLTDEKLTWVTLGYIEYKLSSIAAKYAPYKQFVVNGQYVRYNDYLKQLSQDTSHITYKLRQAINFVLNDYLPKDKTTFFESIEELSIRLKQHYTDPSELIYFLPPSIFKIDVLFEEDEETDHTLNNLSSGEKQKIFALNSISYHLLNLDSVKLQDQLPFKYSYVNFIFDEVELYYHPELQRTFLNDLIDYLNRVQLNHIKGINCLLITHSPFILSDIPRQNLLALTLNTEKAAVPSDNFEETFGANIHELLSNSFFLQNGTIGQFAKRKIEKVIQALTDPNKKKPEQQEETRAIINLIGEPLVKIRLTEMFEAQYGEPMNLAQEEERLTRELERIKSLKRSLNND